jgi:uncharacterized iron-regulated protein
MIRSSLVVLVVLVLKPSCHSWSHQPLSRRTILRRLVPEAALVMGANYVLAETLPAAASETGSHQSVGPIILPSQKPGVIWHVARQQALPAIPATLKKIIHKEWFGTFTTATASAARNDAQSSSQTKCQANSGIVCISERHDDSEHHLIQLRCIRCLHGALEDRQRRGNKSAISHKSNAASPTAAPILTVGMECFQRGHQQYLDRFIHDPSYSLNHLNQDTKWDTTWGYDMLLYAPLLTYAKSKGIRLYGLHATDELVQAVLVHGVDAVPSSVLKGVVTQEPGHYQQYQQLMKVSPEQLVQNPTFLTHFDRMYQVQCFREEYMAESVLLEVNRHLKHPQGHWTAVLAGENHILGRGGIPSRALRRLSSSLLASTGSYSTQKILPKNRGVFTVMPRTIAFPMVANDAPDRMAAHYVWYVESDNLEKDQVNASPLRHQT